MMERTRKGFTLAELLIVIAIIAVLVAIAFPVFTSSLAKARLSVDRSNQRTVKAYAAILELTGEVKAGGTTISISDSRWLKKGDQAVYCLMADGSLREVLAPGSSNVLPQFPKSGAYLAQADETNEPKHKKGQYLLLYVARDAAGEKLATRVYWGK